MLKKKTNVFKYYLLSPDAFKNLINLKNPIENRISDIINSSSKDDTKLVQINNLINQNKSINSSEKNSELASQVENSESLDISIEANESNKNNFDPKTFSSPSRKKQNSTISDISKSNDNIINIDSTNENNTVNSLVNNSEIDLSREKNSFIENLKAEAGNNDLDLRNLSFDSLTNDLSYVQVRDRNNNTFYFPQKPSSYQKYQKALDEISPRKTRYQKLMEREKKNNYKSSNFLPRWAEYENIILKRKQEQDLNKNKKKKRVL